ncbi:lysis protein [Escherichia coli]|nr:lysis protein [Escherichia coli]
MGGNVEKVKALIIAVIVCIIAGLTAVTCYYQSEAARLQEEVTTTQGALKTASNTIQQMKERNAELSKLDKRYHDEIKAIRSDIADLRAGIDNGSIGVYIKGMPATNTATSASSVGDGQYVRLTRDNEQIVLDLKESIAKDREKINYLQDYINNFCLKGSDNHESNR